ncbi:MAG: hypothetical protein HON23_00830 [Rickettsiales bacterium]|jgi:hypothetical protein|nr:hypothetical protein [Rickettsiales bacterium]
MIRLFLFLFIFSCSSVDRVPDFDLALLSGYDLEPLAPEEKLNIGDLYEFSDFKNMIIAMEFSSIDADELDQYEVDVSNFFERVSNSSSKEFYLNNSQIKINIAIVNSFEILEAGLFCREYTQVIDFDIANVSMTGVACRGDREWNVLKKIN